MLKVVHEESQSNAHAPAAVGGSLLDELVRGGARLMLAAALQAEVAAYIEVYADQVDGIHLRVRLEQDKVCLLVMIGVRVDGTKELVALADGFRESSESWAGLLRSCKRRGMRAPVLAVGDGALGFWTALREVFPEAKEQRGSTPDRTSLLRCRSPRIRARRPRRPRSATPRTATTR